jgi:FAD/FMN-containing dehydrogenases
VKELFPNRPDLVVHDDALYRTIYSVDASIFEVMPTCVLIPHSKEALIEVVKVCFEHQIPMTVRGAATGIAGSAIGAGAVIDVTFLNHLIALDVERLQVTLEPGMVQDNLNDLLKPYSLRLGPDTSSGNRATIGGMLGCNASGARSLKFGPIVDAVISLRLLLDDGTEILLETVTAAEFIERQKLPGKEGLLYRHLAALRDDFLQFPQPLWPKRRSSGYRLEELLSEDKLCLAKLVVGAEGTLGIITEVTLSLVPDLKEQSIYLYQFETVEEALDAVSPLLNQKLTSLELVDNHIIQIARELPRYQQISWLQGGVFLAVEMDACAHHQPLNSAKSMKCLKTPEEQALFWEVRKNGLGLLLSRRSFSRAAAFLEDLVVPTHSLKPFYQALCHLLGDRLKETGVYGHAGEGCLHIRPFVNLDSEADLEWMKELMYETVKLVRSFDGVLSGEHGDGRIRSWLSREQFGPEWQRAFEMLKECFDPHNLFNPGIKVEGSFKRQNLRKSLSHTKEPLTFLDFSNEGGVALSVDLCNGNGACRKSTGVMCPSFQASGEEFDSTRARAKALTAALYHEDGFALDELKEVLDRCLSCKGCLSDCPSQVDMAKLKAEVSWAYYQKMEPL